MLFLYRRLGEKIKVIDHNTGDHFDIIVTEAKIHQQNQPMTSFKIGIIAGSNYELQREEIIYPFLKEPIAKAVIGFGFARKKFSCSIEQLYNRFSQHYSFPEDMGYNEFYDTLHTLSKKFDEINYFIKIELTENDTVRIIDNNFLRIQQKKMEKLNEI